MYKIFKKNFKLQKRNLFFFLFILTFIIIGFAFKAKALHILYWYGSPSGWSSISAGEEFAGPFCSGSIDSGYECNATYNAYPASVSQISGGLKINLFYDSKTGNQMPYSADFFTLTNVDRYDYTDGSFIRYNYWSGWGGIKNQWGCSPYFTRSPSCPASIGQGSENYFFDYGVQSGHTYQYYIVSYDSGGYPLGYPLSIFSYVLSQTFTYNPTPPPAFTSVSSSSACSGTNPYVQVSWQASGSNGTYYIYRNGSYVTSVYGGSGSSYFDYGVADASSYTYTLYTYGPGGGPAVANTYTTTPLCKPPPSPPTVNLQLGRNPINYGESTYLYWQIYNATIFYPNFTSSPNYTEFLNAALVAPGDNTTYYATAYNGPDQWGRWSTPTYNQITLFVNKPPPTVNIIASPNPITAGSCSTLNWSFFNSDSVISNFGIVRNYASPTSGSGQTVACPGSTTIYFIQGSNTASGQGAYQQVAVNVYPQPSVSLTATPNPITFGSCATLNWSYSNATSVNSNFNVVRSWNPPQSESGTVNACPNTTTTYNMQASSYTGPGASASVTVTVLRPTLNVSPSAWNINLPQGSNASQLFLVTTSLGNYPWTVSADQPWLSFDQASGTTPSSFTATANVSSFPLGTYTANITVSAPATSNSPVVIPVTINITGVSRIIGDIFAQGRISGLSVDPRSVVVSQSGQIVVSGTTYTIPNYNFATALNWTLAKAQMEQNVSRLKSTKAMVYRPQGTDNVIIDGTSKPAFNLNPDPAFGSDPFSNPNIDPNSPDGGVFWIKGNLTLKNTQFKAKGTIIVDGNLIVEGDTSYSAATVNSSLGIIVLGNINVRPSVNNLVGAYFTPNNLVLESGSGNLFTFNGLFIGGTSLSINRESFTISYDPRIVSLTPPGFSQFYLPTFREATP